MLRRIFLKGMGVTIVGFFSRDVQPKQTTPSGITIQDLPADRPGFKRRYTAHINDEVSMKIELQTSYGNSRYDMSELDQRNGSWVLFDLHRPADKILDREILPTVQKLCAEIVEIDRTYIDARPNEFTDEGGVRWRRVETS